MSFSAKAARSVVPTKGGHHESACTFAAIRSTMLLASNATMVQSAGSGQLSPMWSFNFADVRNSNSE